MSGTTNAPDDMRTDTGGTEPTSWATAIREGLYVINYITLWSMIGALLGMMAAFATVR